MDAPRQLDSTFITPLDRQRIDSALTEVSKDSTSWELHLSKKKGREIEIRTEKEASAPKNNSIRVNPGLYDLFW